MHGTFGLQHQQRRPGSTSFSVLMLGLVLGSVGEFAGRAGTYAGWAMPMTVETVENLEDVGGEGGDAREGRCAFVGKNGGSEGVFVGTLADAWGLWSLDLWNADGMRVPLVVLIVRNSQSTEAGKRGYQVRLAKKQNQG